MKNTEYFLRQLDSEVEKCKRVIEQMPEGKGGLEAAREVDAIRVLDEHGRDDAVVDRDGCQSG